MTRDEIRAALQACSRGGVVLAPDLRRAGVTGRDIQVARHAGELERWAMSTYILGGTPDTPLQRGAAALAVAGPGSVLSGLWAARVLGLRWIPDGGPVMVLVPGDRRRRGSEAWFEVRRCTGVEDVPTLSVAGLPIAHVSQVVVDACRQADSLQDVRGIVLGAVADGRCTVAEILQVVERSASAGTRWVRRACQDAERGAASPPEAEAADAFLGAGLPFYVNCAVYLDDVLLGVVDVWLVGRGTGGELDSREWHAEADALDSTLLRDRTFSRAGLSLEHITPMRFRGSPAAFVQALHNEADRRTALGMAEPAGLRLEPRGPLLS